MHAGSTKRLATAYARLAAALLVGAAACRADVSAGDDPVPAVEASATPKVGLVVDSLRPIAEEIQRFQVEFGTAERLEGAATRDALIERFVTALESADTAALVALPLSAAEFGSLYYPHTRFTAPPYELAPGLLWFQTQNSQSRGATRLLRRFAGAPIGYVGYYCELTPQMEGPNRVWDDCLVRLRGQAGDTVALRLFGSVVERDGAFRLVSLANDL